MYPRLGQRGSAVQGFIKIKYSVPVFSLTLLQCFQFTHLMNVSPYGVLIRMITLFNKNLSEPS